MDNKSNRGMTPEARNSSKQGQQTQKMVSDQNHIRNEQIQLMHHRNAQLRIKSQKIIKNGQMVISPKPNPSKSDNY